MRTHFKLPMAVLLTVLAACGGERKPAAESTAARTAAPTAPTSTGPVTPAPGGKIIVVELASDDKGNYFTPSEVTAKRGDVIRYTLKVGVHNVHFLADSNAGRSGYPAAPSDMLQLPGQTYDVLVNFPEGKYYFQCDPHAALGMKGHLLVQ